MYNRDQIHDICEKSCNVIMCNTASIFICVACQYLCSCRLQTQHYVPLVLCYLSSYIQFGGKVFIDWGFTCSTMCVPNIIIGAKESRTYSPRSLGIAYIPILLSHPFDIRILARLGRAVYILFIS